MSIPSHLVSAKIAEARARGALERPSTDEARILADMERVLAELPAAVGRDALRLRAQLALHERDPLGRGVVTQLQHARRVA